MLSTKQLITDISEVPDSWIFEYYAALPEQLNGNEVNIKSLFNDADRKPSMYIFFSEKFSKYWFHDFSTRKTGDAIRLVQELRHCSYGKACDIIKADFARYQTFQSYVPGAFTGTKKYRVTQFSTRSWNVLDAGFWTSFNIGSGLLEAHEVRPLEHYIMQSSASPSDQFKVWGEYMYGYFKSDGTLYKIYRPKHRDCKFIKVQDHVQGWEQLKDKPCLLIAASLKDALSVKSLGLELDVIAPESENIYLPDLLINELLTRYHGMVFVMLDNDETGIKAMKHYRTRHQLLPILIERLKDFSDSMERYGPSFMLQELVPKIDRNIAQVLARVKRCA